MVGEVAYSGGSGWAGHGTSATPLAKRFLNLGYLDSLSDLHKFRGAVRAGLDAFATTSTEALIHGGNHTLHLDFFLGQDSGGASSGRLSLGDALVYWFGIMSQAANEDTVSGKVYGS